MKCRAKAKAGGPIAGRPAFAGYASANGLRNPVG